MKKLICLLFIAACGKSGPKAGQSLIHLDFFGSKNTFTETQTLSFNSDGSVENSFINFGGELFSLRAPWADGRVVFSDAGSSGLEIQGSKVVLSGSHFTYAMENAGSFYLFGESGNDVYLWKSADMQSWVKINGGLPVLTHQANTLYAHLWNVGVAVDDQNTWHMLIESGNNTDGSGMTYSNAQMNGDLIDFNANKSADFVIANAGNPDLKFLPGRGLLAVHGAINYSALGLGGAMWFVTASTLATGDNIWVTHSDVFAVGTPGIHVCDPSLERLPAGGTIMSVSVNQNSNSITESTQSLEQIFDSLTL